MINKSWRILGIILMLCAAIGQSWGQTADNYRSYLRNRNVKISETNLPIVFIQTNRQMIQRDNYILAQMKVIHNGDGQLNYGDTVAHRGQTIDYEGYIALKYRGNSSFSSSDKKPLAFRTLESDVLPDYGGKKLKVRILGMPKDNKWGFIAPWCDETMIRDILSFELGRPWFDWVPNARMCEVILDGTYYGVYVLCERVSKGKHRLNLDDPTVDEKGNIVADWHVCVDHGYDPFYESKHHPWATLDGSRESRFTVKYEYDDPGDDEFWELPDGTREALHADIDRMEDVFLENQWLDHDKGYRRLVDPMSFIDYMLSTEVSMNIDGYRLSTHLYKHSDKRQLTEGIDPRWKTTLWDFNIAWGNANYYGGERTDQWQYMMNINNSGDDCPVPFYWYKMLMDPDYVSALKQRWQEYRQTNHSDQRLFATIDSLTTLLTAHGAAERNETAWGIYNRSNIWPLPYYAKNYEQAVSYLKNWIQQRLVFMDKNLLPPRVIETEPIIVASGWNADIVAEGTPVSNYSTTSVDASNRVFFSALLREEGGLPINRRITSNNEAVQYQLASYVNPNALNLHDVGDSGTLEFRTPVLTNELFVLGTSGNGDSEVSVTLHYADGTDEQLGTYGIRDWSVRTPRGDEAVTALGNIRRDTNIFSDDPHYCLFEFSVPVDDTRMLSSVTFTSANSAYASIMGLSRIKPSTTDIPSLQPTPDFAAQPTSVYSLGGVRQSAPSRKGITIIRMSDGSIRKVVTK